MATKKRLLTKSDGLKGTETFTTRVACESTCLELRHGTHFLMKLMGEACNNGQKFSLALTESKGIQATVGRARIRGGDPLVPP